MEKKLQDIREKLQSLIRTMDDKGIEGPIGFLEEAIEDIDRAILELENY